MSADRAKIIAPPPLIGLACIAAGFLARHFCPWPIFIVHTGFETLIGVCLVIMGASIIFTARKQFIAHGTDLNPYRPTAAIVTSGVYALSRNPIYIAFLLVVIAFAFFANSWWFLVSAALLFLILNLGVVNCEEQYLAEKFGDTYNAYRQRVRRWI